MQEPSGLRTCWQKYATMFIACEQALLFGQAKRAARILARLVSLAQKRRACSQATMFNTQKYNNPQV